MRKLGWTGTLQIPQKQIPNGNKEEINYNTTLCNRIKKPENKGIQNDMLQMLRKMEEKKHSERKKDT